MKDKSASTKDLSPTKAASFQTEEPAWEAPAHGSMGSLIQTRRAHGLTGANVMAFHQETQQEDTKRLVDLNPDVARAMEHTTGLSVDNIQVKSDTSLETSGILGQADRDSVRLSPKVDPTSKRGFEVLAHESAHMLQMDHGQSSGASPGASGVMQAEVEANAVSRAALQGTRQSIQTPATPGLAFTEIDGFDYKIASPNKVKIVKDGMANKTARRKGEIKPDADKGEQPGYLIASAAIPQEIKPNIFSKYYDEAWSTPEEREQAVARTAAVVGVNLWRPIATDAEKASKTKIKTAINSIDTKAKQADQAAYGFLWEPQWVKDDDDAVTDFDTVREAYNALGGDEKSQVKAKEKQEATKYLPYAAYREEVIGSDHAQRFSKRLSTAFNPVYTVMQDGDTSSVKTQDGKGILSKYDEVIEEIGRHPLLLIGGYNFDVTDDKWGGDALEGTEKLTKLSNEIDRATRAAISATYPEMLYPAEPNTLVRTRDKAGKGIHDNDALMGDMSTDDEGYSHGKVFGGGKPTARKWDAEGRNFRDYLSEHTHADEFAADDKPILFRGDASIATDPTVPKPENIGSEDSRKDRGLAVTPEHVRRADVDKGRFHPLRLQSQQRANSYNLDNEYSRASGTTKGVRKKAGTIFGVVDQATDHLAQHGSMTDEIRDGFFGAIDAPSLGKMPNKALRQAELDKAKELAKNIITALNADELRDTWDKLKQALDAIHAAK